MMTPSNSNRPAYLVPVGQTETPTALRLRRARAETRGLFVFDDMARIGPVCSGPQVLVWGHLRNLQHVRGPQAWLLADLALLRAWGVSKRTYQRALTKLEQVGAVETRRQRGRRTRVRLRVPLPVEVR